MAQGVIFRGQCVSVDDYLGQMLGEMTPGSYFSGVDTYSWSYSIDGSNIAQTTLKNGVFYQYSWLFTTPPSNCDTTELFFDGLTLGWGVVFAMIAAWAIHVLRRGI